MTLRRLLLADLAGPGAGRHRGGPVAARAVRQRGRRGPAGAAARWWPPRRSVTWRASPTTRPGCWCRPRTSRRWPRRSPAHRRSRAGREPGRTAVARAPAPLHHRPLRGARSSAWWRVIRSVRRRRRTPAAAMPRPCAFSARTASRRPTAGSRPPPRTSPRLPARTGWRVIVYCQVEGPGRSSEDEWNGIERVTIPVDRDGWLGTSPSTGARSGTRCQPRPLPHLRLQHRGLQHRAAAPRHPQRHQHGRDRVVARALGRSPSRRSSTSTNASPAGSATTSSPTTRRSSATCARKARGVEDRHDHLRRDAVTEAPTEPVTDARTRARALPHAVCRPIPENSILELVTASRRDRGASELVVVGDYDPTRDDYHRAVVEAAASDEVDFPGAIYDPDGARRPSASTRSATSTATRSAAPTRRSSRRWPPATR